MTGDILLRKLVAVIPSNYFSFCISKVWTDQSAYTKTYLCPFSLAQTLQKYA